MCIVVNDGTNDGSYMYTGTEWKTYINPTSLSALTDTNISSASNKQLLVYNQSSNKWINNTYSHTDLTDVGTKSHSIIDTFISSKNSAFGLCHLGSDSKVPSANMPSILHSSLPDAESITHVNLDAMYNRKNAANGICPLNASSKVPIANLDISISNLNNVNITSLNAKDILRYDNTLQNIFLHLQ